jgi:hypothetical protein
MKFGISLFILLTVITVNFQNCGKFNISLKNDNPIPSMCTHQLKQKALLENPKPEDCEDFTQYTCEHRGFHPDVMSGQTEANECFESAQLGRICVKLLDFNFNTENNKSMEIISANAFKTGGEFNRDEFKCYNAKYLMNDIPIYLSEGRNVNEALVKTMMTCQSGGAP